MELDFNTQCQIESDIRTIEHLLSLNPFYTISDIEVQKALFTEIMICLRELVIKSANILKKRINFEDGVIKYQSGKITVNDITDLINFMRNAACHEDSPNRKFGNHTFSFNIFSGCSYFFGIKNGENIPCDYPDDISINYGPEIIYYSHHIVRAFEECKQNFKAILGE